MKKTLIPSAIPFLTVLFLLAVPRIFGSITDGLVLSRGAAQRPGAFAPGEVM
jgi:hypothetical protein